MQQEIRLDLFLYNQLDETVLEKEQLQSGYDLVSGWYDQYNLMINQANISVGDKLKLINWTFNISSTFSEDFYFKCFVNIK